MLRPTEDELPMPQIATIKVLPRAFPMMKAMEAQGVEWGEDSVTPPERR